MSALKELQNGIRSNTDGKMDEKQKTRVVNNVLAACRDITLLRKSGYDFLYLCNGFIAHYNIHGFIDYYSTCSLRDDILRNEFSNQYGNFRPGEDMYEYYMSKKDVYRRIVAALKG